MPKEWCGEACANLRLPRHGCFWQKDNRSEHSDDLLVLFGGFGKHLKEKDSRIGLGVCQNHGTLVDTQKKIERWVFTRAAGF